MAFLRKLVAILSLVLGTLCSQVAVAQVFLLECGSLHGIRGDFKEDQLLPSKDGMSQARPKLQYDVKTKKGSLIVEDSSGAIDKTEVALLTVNDFYSSFLTMVNGAPTLLNYYPKSQILMYSQPSVSIASYEPSIKAFVSKCEKKPT